jgi:hypothetical protein
MLKKTLLLISISFTTTLLLQAQERYAVQVGNFMDARAEDFSGLRSIGFVYATRIDAEVSRVMLGGYDTKAAAERAVAQVRAKGYPNAYAQQIFLQEGMVAAVIQVGTEKSNARINWQRYATAGELYGIMGADDIRIVTKPYASMEDARKSLDGVRKLGFKDAFVRTVNSMTLHRLAEFETGIKKPLIPLNIQKETAVAQPSIAVIPASYENTDQRVKSPDAIQVIPPPAASAANTGTASMQPRSAGSVALVQAPVIRGNIKRRSALDLQQALKAEGAYTGSLDGYYGNGTTAGYNTFASSNRQMLRYRSLAENAQQPGLSPTAARFQKALDNMHNDAAAVVEVTTAGGALAKAYQAYVLFANRGASNEVNQLMNAAIRESFQGKTMRKAPPFDIRSTYSYDNLDQLLLHIHYLHSAPGNAVTAPCWLAQRHPAEMARVYETYAGYADADFPFRACDQFAAWSEIAMMTSMAQDLGVNTAENAAAAAKRAKLFSAPPAPQKDEEIALENWNIRVWKGLDTWAQRDPLNKDLITAFRVAYHQSQVRLEDHFMDKGFNAEAARSLALTTLQTMVGHHLQRFL